MVIRVVGGVLACVVGTVWFLQGIGTVGGSAMSGHAFWSFAGAVLVMLGIRLFFGARRARIASAAGERRD